MSDTDRLTAFSTTHLGGRTIPPDLAILLKMQWNRVPDPSGERYADPLEAIAFRFWSGDKHSALLDMSYLNDRDRANPDIMANIAATRDVFADVVFVGEDDDANAYGYWLGPENRPIDGAPIVRYDTEGQFELRQGIRLVEALLADRGSHQETEFLALRDWLNTFGLSITASSNDALPWPDTKPTPADLNKERYNVHRLAAGLPPLTK